VSGQSGRSGKLCWSSPAQPFLVSGPARRITILFCLTTLNRERNASRPGHFTPGTHWIGRWLGPRVVLDIVEKRKISCYFRPTPDVQPVAIPTELSPLIDTYVCTQTHRADERRDGETERQIETDR
jgi:hypothetical protein